MPRTAKKAADKPAKKVAKKAKAAGPGRKKSVAGKLPLVAKPVAAITRAAATATRVLTRATGGKAEVVAVLSRTVTNDQIATEAYYIAERRRKMGIPGDSQADWLEAERKLRG